MNLVESLTEREEAVTKEIVHGKTNREIAESLVISINTVQTHVSHALQKTGTTNRTQLAMFAMQANLLKNH